MSDKEKAAICSRCGLGWCTELPDTVAEIGAWKVVVAEARDRVSHTPPGFVNVMIYGPDPDKPDEICVHGINGSILKHYMLFHEKVKFAEAQREIRQQDIEITQLKSKVSLLQGVIEDYNREFTDTIALRDNLRHLLDWKPVTALQKQETKQVNESSSSSRKRPPR